MSAVDSVETHAGLPLQIRRLAATEDRRHLLVILSGFRPVNAPYDFAQSSAAQIGCDVLWIQDAFEGRQTYYLRARGGTEPEQAIQAAIRAELDRLDLRPDRLTIAGFSKGGSAALYHGLALGAANVLATVPQLHIGTYVRDYWPKVFDYMTTPDQDDTAVLDRILPDHIAAHAGSPTNVYVLSSERDPWHAKEIVPNLPAFQALGRFTLIMSSWPRIQEHVNVTPHNRALVVSLLVQLTQGLAPRFEQTHIGELPISQKMLDGQWERRELVAVLDKLTARGDRIFPEGVAFIRGRPVSEYGDIGRSLVLSNGEASHSFEVGTVLDESLSTRFHRVSTCDYTAGGFASIGYGGVAMSGIGPGTYDLDIEIRQHGQTHKGPLRGDRTITAVTVAGDRAARIRVTTASATVDVFSVLAGRPERYELRPDVMEVRAGQLDLRGWLAVAGMPVKEWGDVEYYLVLSGPDGSVTTYRMGLLHRPRADVQVGDPDDFVKAYFAPRGDSALDLSSLELGEYALDLTIANHSRQHTVRLGTLHVEGVFQGDRKVSEIALVGSRVTRDNFSARTRPGWRRYADIVGEHYQASLLAIFGAPVQVTEGEFADLEPHAATLVRRELGREFLRVMSDIQPDAVIVDLFTDARFGVIDLPEGAVTDNEWTLLRSQDASRFSKAPRLSLAHDRDEYLRRIEAAARQLDELVRAQNPDAALILHGARGARRWRDDVGERSFPATAVQRFNQDWDALDAAFLRGAPRTVVIGGPDGGAIGDARHPSGKHWVHYEPGYYAALTEQLQSVLGFRREFRLEAGPRAGTEKPSLKEPS